MEEKNISFFSWGKEKSKGAFYTSVSVVQVVIMPDSVIFTLLYYYMNAVLANTPPWKNWILLLLWEKPNSIFQTFLAQTLGLSPISPLVPDWLTDWLTPAEIASTLTGDLSDFSPTTLTHHSLMLGLWNFNRSSLTIIQLLSGDLTYLCQLIIAEISC